MPAFVSTLCICIVFVPMFFLTGVARYLFVPLAEAVVFAMLASYVLSRTLVPTMAKYLLRGARAARARRTRRAATRSSRLQRALRARASSGCATATAALLERCVAQPRLLRGGVPAVLRGVAACSCPWLGQDFFPAVDSGQFKLHLRAPTGTRIEETAALCDRVERVDPRA